MADQTNQVITRFAPSPTGFLHIGGVRTALFNWLFARHHDGKYLLRIEDTDKERSTPEAIAAILDALSWLGLDHDEDPVFQSKNADRHVAVARDMVERGLAYPCYCSPEELDAMREAARAEGRAVAYDRRWRDRDPAEAPADVTPVIRFKAPTDGATVIRDSVQGDVRINNDQLDDVILLRSDGTPTYMLSVVVDDHDMGITHIIRGDDHLTNAARQIQIYEALGWDVPAFSHVPMIHGPDGAKLSKRHGALGAEAYREMGYLPAGLLNYLARLGWSHGDDELFTMDQAISWFDGTSINKAPARMDYDKLANVNAHHIKTANPADLAKLVATEIGEDWTDAANERFVAMAPALTERAKTLHDLADASRFLVNERPLTIDDKSVAKLDDEAKSRLTTLTAELEALADWNHDSLNQAIRDFAEAEGIGLGKIGMPLRAALAGTMQAPGFVDILLGFGRDESLNRLKDQL